MTREPSDTEIALASRLGQIPSVTTILGAMGLRPSYNGVPSATLERKRLLGKALHAAIQYDAEGRLDPTLHPDASLFEIAILHAIQYEAEGALDETSLHPDVARLLSGFRAYRAVLAGGFRIERAEVELIDAEWRVVGHPDALGVAPAGQPAIIDWKFSEGYDLDAAAYQLAAYRWLVRHVLGQDRVPYVIELHADGRPNVTALDKRIAELNAEQIFLASVLVYHARERRRS